MVKGEVFTVRYEGEYRQRYLGEFRAGRESSVLKEHERRLGEKDKKERAEKVTKRTKRASS